MKKPVCPRVPTKPKKPGKHTNKVISLGQRSAWDRRVNLAAFVERMKQTASRKTGRKPEDIELEDLYVYDYNLKMAVCDGTPNPKFQEEMKKYTEVELPKYKEAMKRYKDRMRIYYINKELWDAWQLKQHEDELKNQLKQIQSSLKEVEAKRKALVDSKG